MVGQVQEGDGYGDAAAGRQLHKKSRKTRGKWGRLILSCPGFSNQL